MPTTIKLVRTVLSGLGIARTRVDDSRWLLHRSFTFPAGSERTTSIEGLDWSTRRWIVAVISEGCDHCKSISIAPVFTQFG